MAEMQRYKMTVAYDGTLFCGWQKQEPPGAVEPLRTVQGVIEDALVRLLGQRINLVGASRTDSGVHARGQVAQFDAATRIPLERLGQAINGRLPGDVEVRDVEVAPHAKFDCINDCKSKQYRYRLWHTHRRPLELRHAVYHCWTPLDVERMREAGRRLVGMHDFEGFAAAGHGRASTIRTVHDCRVDVDEPEVQIVVSGDGFLYNQVRIMAGTLVEVGRGRFGVERVDEVLGVRERRLAGPTLPPGGLWLEWVRY